MKENLFYIMSPSVYNWFESFSNMFDADNWKIKCLNESNYDIKEELNRLADKKNMSMNLFILSSHRSLSKDIVFAKELVNNGYTAHCQNEVAAQLGNNKISFKQMLNNNGLPTPEWGVAAQSADHNYLIKKADGTETVGIKWYRVEDSGLSENDYFERYISGEEYSVNVFSENGESVIFPVVYKGRTTEELLPPYKRVRCCGEYGEQLLPHIEKMQMLSSQIADIINNFGFMEVEFILTDDGSIKILELNPRISGTLRMSALAAGVPCFDLYVTPVKGGILRCVNTVFECPYQGKPYHDKVTEIYCTSRASFVANTHEELREKVDILSKLDGNFTSLGEFETLIKCVLLKRSIYGH